MTPDELTLFVLAWLALIVIVVVIAGQHDYVAESWCVAELGNTVGVCP